MEPSIRSSSYRGKECSLRKTTPALHDATKRIVESHFSDCRISQYADVEFATKKIENNTWYWLEPLSSGRQGFLVFQPNQPIVWMDDQMKFSHIIPIRVSSAVTSKVSIFLASLSRSEGILRIEDCWLLSGTQVKTPFSIRWNKVLDFFLSYYHYDSHLQQGLSIVPAEFKPLVWAKGWVSTPTMMLAQGETFPRRLRVQFIKYEQEEKKGNPILPNPIPNGVGVSTPGQNGLGVTTPGKNGLGVSTPISHRNQKKETPIPKKPTRALFLVDQIDSVKEEVVDESIAKAVAHPEYPDTYDIWIQGKKKGFAAVQDIELSRQLRKMEQKEISVKVEWNTEFNMFEILSITP